jgi:uncharacterized protein YbbC (DUF1343 family)
MRILFWFLFAFAFCLCTRPEAAILTGAEQLEEHLGELRNRKIALVINHTSRVSDTLLPLYLQKRGINVKLIFSPEHGLYGQAGAGEKVGNSIDTATGIPIISLYGQNKSLDTQALKDIDLILFDMQDVGARFYTYLSTLHFVLKAAGLKQIPIWVLDRPNPMIGFVDGPVLDSAFTSFVGMHPIPILHGMTFGELSQMIVQEGWLGISTAPQLKVISMKNYTGRDQYSLPVAPSPNLKTDRSILWYPSLCLFEGTPVSMGRGTPYPFEVLLLPDSLAYEGVFQAWEKLEGAVPIRLMPVSMPSAPKPPFVGQKCRGIRFTSPPAKGVDLQALLLAYANYPDPSRFFNSFFNRLAGTDQLSKGIKMGLTETEIYSTWQKDIAAFKEKRKKYLIYPR